MNAETSVEQPQLSPVPVWVQGQPSRIGSGMMFLDLDMEKTGSTEWYGVPRCLMGEPIASTLPYYACQTRLETWEVLTTSNATSISPRLGQDLEELRGQVEAGDVRGARQLLREIVRRHGTSAEVVRWQHVLAEPRAVATEKTSGGGLRENAAWIRGHGDQFRGQWVALRGGNLLESDRRLSALHRRIERSGDIESVIFVRIPG